MEKFVRKIVDRIMEVEGKSQQEVGMQLFDKSKQVFSRQISTNKLDFVKLIAWAVSKNIDLNWLVTGQGTAPDKRYNKDDYAVVIEREHSNLIKQFQDKALAKAINKDLIRLESLNEEAFREVGSYIKGLIQGLQLASKQEMHTNRRIKDRRQQIDDENIPDGVDRRCGIDRRRMRS